MFEPEKIVAWAKQNELSFRSDESVIIFELADNSDFDFRLTTTEDEVQLQAVLRGPDRQCDMWYMIFRKEDYRSPELFENHLFATLRKVLQNPTSIDIRKGLFFIQFELSVADESGSSSLHTYGITRWFCTPPNFNGRKTEFRGIPASR
jgi:hypothetical protein